MKYDRQRGRWNGWGGEPLPQPLTRDEEAELIGRASAGDEAALHSLIVHNLRYVVSIARGYKNTGIDLDDLISIGTIGLMKAARTYSQDKNTRLSTYANRCIQNEILMENRKAKKRKPEVSLDEPICIDRDGNELRLMDILGTDADIVEKDIEADSERQMLYDAVGSLSERERRIVCKRYALGSERAHTQREVAQLIGITQSYASRVEARAIGKLREHMQAMQC